MEALSDEYKKLVEELVYKVKVEVDSLEARVREAIEKGDREAALKSLREGVENVLREIADSTKKLEEYGGRVENSVLEKALEDFRTGLRQQLERVRSIVETVSERYGRRAVESALSVSDTISRSLAEIASTATKLAQDLAERVAEVVGRIARLPGTTLVVSARVRKEDMEVIDKLVEAGVFKSRSEAIAYFTRKGIEASRDWIEKALEKAEKIRELARDLRKDVEEYLEK
ncbi:M protein [Desulfurococcus amylolyticus]|uniref:M protein n=1 Tax=Desulfurococcus amylolyticus TaxID=94694 RepID=UPI001E5546F7|nr:M protein [Desulfurococcus amylolyticus]